MFDWVGCAVTLTTAKHCQSTVVTAPGLTDVLCCLLTVYFCVCYGILHSMPVLFRVLHVTMIFFCRSLLAYDRASHTFRHYDSSAGCGNSHVAKRLFTSLHRAVSGGHPCTLEAHVAGMPQQTNGYDCGVYVLAVADALCAWLGSGLLITDQEGGMAREMTPQAVSWLRQHIKQLINERRNC